MSRRLTVTDGYAIINAMAAEMFGTNFIAAIDGSSFVSCGEAILASGTENVINTLSLVTSRSLIAIRPYEAKFRLINALDSGVFSNRIRKISYYAKNATPTGASNTQLFDENLGMGFDNGVHYDSSTPPVQKSVESMWLQSAPVVHETWFGGGTEWQYPYTLYDNALKLAFRSPEDWAEFLNGFLVSCANDIEFEKEACSRLLMLNAITGTVDMGADMPDSSVNMTNVYNDTYGTSYTTQQILESHFDELLACFVATVKDISDYMECRTTKFHWSPAKTVNGVSYVLPRQTKKEDQRMMMVSKFWNAAEARVLPAIFNDQYLKLENFEKVAFWQNLNDPYSIKFTPAIPDTSDPTQQIQGDPMDLPVVLGCIFDRDAIMVDFQLDDVSVSPREARKHYRTVWNTVRKNLLWDACENMVVFYMYDTP